MVNQGNNTRPESDFVDLDDTNEGIKKVSNTMSAEVLYIFLQCYW